MKEEPHPPNSAQLVRRLKEAAVPAAACIALIVLLYLLIRLSVMVSAVLLPCAVALLLAALLHPVVHWLQRLHVPRWLATALVLLAGVAVIGGILAFAVNAIVSGLTDLQATLQSSLSSLRHWLVHGPLNLSQRQIEEGIDNLTAWLRERSDQLASSVTATASALMRFLAGTVLALFVLVILLHDGERVHRAVVRAMPRDLAHRADQRIRRAFAQLSTYVRASIGVALIDAIGIGAGLVLLGVPLALPLASLVFLGGFVPFVGAFVTGGMAVLVAFVTKGPLVALVVFAIVIGVQQLEGNILQPLLLGKAVRLHPLVVVLAVSTGAVTAGIVGAVFAVPLVIVLRALFSPPSHQSDERHA
ncbi:AI-2E family transporter [Lentzea sp. NEAU-D7]|uniref:AI-2E family transporter n=1 Tax=Lentzea sp. NEAU-D7 TaxID=2994667 RepID=UPI00224B2F5A|nr:AI-2E family transporter [Lentzea sp. NEAU-D7]MCX2948872.1 AI-2E family transporter [Lentzea sp. NEAU-D7]